MTSENILTARVIDDRARLNISNTTNLQMIAYLSQINRTVIETLIKKTVRPRNYQIQNDYSDQEDYIDKPMGRLNMKLQNKSLDELLKRSHSVIDYSNYRKLFNKTLYKFYKDQVIIEFGLF